jgi:hypothetical protein
MEEHRQQLQFIFSIFACSVIERTDNDLNIICYTDKQVENITENYSAMPGKGGFLFSV